MSSRIQILEDKEQCSEAVLLTAAMAELELCLFSQNLEPLLYNRSEFCDLLSTLARKNRRSHIKIIAQDTRNAVSEGHCLISLMRRLSSSIQIRIPATEELKRFSESWLIADQNNMVQLNDPDRYQGTLVRDDRIHVKPRLEYFLHAWEFSEPDPYSRNLHL